MDSATSRFPPTVHTMPAERKTYRSARETWFPVGTQDSGPRDVFRSTRDRPLLLSMGGKSRTTMPSKRGGDDQPIGTQTIMNREKRQEERREEER
ncbi:hypothetical protein EYF80_058425 [Liparis tanakae]|uniref:Uncharacterized protein n=1 Tax=Liparis tanakae TaxID=230148 RepID=A0A4Z2ET07_9TELE|nr:hypothetical protein EYF80_058425 [Liparis tanakae]